jgi:hypothetical protein
VSVIQLFTLNNKMLVKITKNSQMMNKMETHKMKNGSTMKGSMMKGGLVTKTGLYKLHSGEVVVTKSRVKSVDNALKETGKKPLKK